MTAQDPAVRQLAGWLSAPRPGRGVRIAGGSDGWESREYPEIARSARRVASALIADGVVAGDVVCVLMPTGFDLLTAFFGVWAAGATPCLISPPAFTAEDDYAARVAAVLAQAAPRLSVTVPELVPVTAQAMVEAGLDGAPWPLREADAEAAQVTPGELALLQFTSGSSGAPRGARVTWANLAANITLIKDWLDWSDGDVTASWLPLYHDMGLIGCLLTPVTAQCDLWLMRPGQFIREPLRWLECMAFAQHTAAPPFALDYTARRVRPEQLAELDLSGWRNMIVGAELIEPTVLEDFARLTEPAGFSRSAYRTAYGLAEATLAVTAHCGAQPPRAVRPDVATLRVGMPVGIKELYRVGAAQPTERTGWVVGCGQPRDGDAVRIVDEGGRQLPPGHLGEIAVTGPSVVDGYHAGRTGGSTRFEGAELRTGDAGFQYDGELFVLGRMGDSLKVRGRSVYVEDLETAVAQETGLARTRFAVVSAPTAGGARVALLAESAPGAWVAAARGALAARLGQDVAITMVSGRSGLVARTTSGKPRRALLGSLLGSGLPEGACVLVPEQDGPKTAASRTRGDG
jgi:fatty-acyl-CoA synthase